ncbi:hypothetical protein FXO38_30691 [Capsicum annuum]|nr:hypothetical protein FXO38_30691 [Capsicum annuum]KAF3656905.1 hypothetical protein FXO37_15235 [Capsicum annuum]
MILLLLPIIQSLVFDPKMSLLYREDNVIVRLYLPKITQNDEKFPLLVYFRGGGFAIESAFSTYYDSYLHSLAAETNVLAVFIQYRLAPEHKIPACYDDSWAVMK